METRPTETKPFDSMYARKKIRGQVTEPAEGAGLLPQIRKVGPRRSIGNGIFLNAIHNTFAIQTMQITSSLQAQPPKTKVSKHVNSDAE